MNSGGKVVKTTLQESSQVLHWQLETNASVTQTTRDVVASVTLTTRDGRESTPIFRDGLISRVVAGIKLPTRDRRGYKAMK